MSLERIEKILFYIFVFILPFQLRLLLHQYGISSLAEYNALFLYATDFVLAVLLVIFLVRFLRSSEFFLKMTWRQRWLTLHEIEPLYWFLIAFWVLTALASFPQRNIALSFYQIIKVAEVILLFAYVTLSFRHYNLTKVLSIFLGSVAFQALLGFLQFVFEKPVSLQWLEGSFPEFNFSVGSATAIRALGTLPHPNLLAVFLSVGMIFLVYLIMKRRFFTDYPNPNFLPKEEERALFTDSLARIALFLLNFWLIVALVLTFSRTVIGLLLAVLVADFLYLWRQKWFLSYQQRFRYIVLVLLGGLVLVSLLAVPELFARTQGSVSVIYQYHNLLDPQASQFIKEKPLFGIGAGNYVFRLQQEQPDLPVLILQPVNNTYLLIASETGLISLGFFIAFLVYLWYGLVKAYRAEQDLTSKLWKSQLLMLFVFIMAVSFFTNTLWVFQQGRLLFWLILGIMVATATEVKKPLNERT